MISAYTASLPERIEALKQSVASILPQVDSIQVVLNNYSHAPEFLNNQKITVVHNNNYLEDGSRFINIGDAKGYVLVFDDDIKYPNDYVETLISKCDLFEKALVSPMGKILKPRPVKSYYRDIQTSYKTFSTVENDVEVDVIGACGVMWNSDKVKITDDIILTPNSDLCLAKFAKENNVKQICIAHKSDWLHDLMQYLPKKAPSIYGKYRHKDEKLTEFVNRWI